MKKELTEQELIALARLAPRVEPAPEKLGKKGKRATHTDPKVTEFLKKLNIKAGRNKASVELLHEAFLVLDPSGIDYDVFFNSMKKLYKVSPDGRIKLNMNPITILEKAKEVKLHEQQKEKSPLS